MKPAEFVITEGIAPPRIRRGRLFRKYFLLILALVCGVLLVSGGISVYFSYQENKSALAALQHEKAIAAATRFEQFIRQIEQQLGFAALPQLGADGLEQRRIEFLKLLRQVPAVTDIAQLDARGHELLAVSRLSMDVAGSSKDRSQDPAFLGAKAGRTWFSPVYFRKETEPYMAIAVRTGGEGGSVVVAEVNLKFIWDVVTRIKIGEKGKAYVVDGSGHLVADPDIGLVLRKTDLSGLEHVKAALGGAEATGEPARLARDLSGKQVLSAYAGIEPLGWKVFVEQPVSEVYATLNATIMRTGILMVAGLLFSALTALWLAGSMVRPIRTLQEGAQRIGEGELEQKIEVKTGDELETLADQFNDMTVKLRESYAGLERKVEERTGELTESLEYQTAISTVLRVISQSPTDVSPVFQAILESAMRLFESPFPAVFRYDGRLVHLVATRNWSPEALEDAQRIYPGPPNPQMMSGRVIAAGEVLAIEDTQADPDYDKATARAGRWRRMLGAPMLKDGVTIGAIVVAWPDAGPTPERQGELLKTFADQAVIAIENVRLINETKEALEQQTATAEILRVISASPTDTQPVFEAIAQSGLNLFENAHVWVVLRDGDTIQAAAISERDPARVARWRAAFPTPLTHDYLNATAILERRIVDIPDVRELDQPLRTGPASFAAAGYRAVTITPMMRGGEAIGAIGVARLKPGPLGPKQVALLQTFADQAVIAIENVRLFNETKEALEHQRASAGILGIIASSVDDARPVFDAIARAAAGVLGNARVQLFLVREGELHHVGGTGLGPQQLEALRQLYPAPLAKTSYAGAAIMEKRTIHVPDVLADPDRPEMTAAIAASTGLRAVLAVPMIREGEAIGCITTSFTEPVAFTDKQIALLKSFADQAVIAIQNARLFREIEEKSRQLEIADKHKSEFLANMSHELRTPLNAIIGFSEVLLERMFGEMNAKQEDYLKDIHSSGRHLLSLINDILDLSKIEAGRMELDIGAFDATAAISNAMTLVRERAQRHGIALVLQADPQLGEIRADERKFKQILLNLLSNAVKFTPDGGRIEVRARLAGALLEVAVSDTGVGIEKEDRQAVFEEFRQVGRHYTNKHEGTGLGLALTKRFVELHGGTVRLESEPGKGSTFTFTIPSHP